MTTGEIISLVALCITLVGLIISFYFNIKKATKERDQERANNINNVAEIKSDIKSINSNVDEIKVKVEKIDDKIEKDHDKIIDFESRIRNLEKAVFSKGGIK